MPTKANPIRLFVSHAWVENDDYVRVFEYLEASGTFYYINSSQPQAKRPLDKESQREDLRRQIAPCEVIIVLPAVYRLAPELEILLVTSRETGRWVIPKGWPMAGLSTAAAAAREAWEEAGVEGKVQDTPLGAFGYDKLARMSVTVRCLVAVHALRVQVLRDRFPEAGQRRRAWFNPAEAAGLVAEPQLQHLLRAIATTPDLLRPPQ